VTASLLTLLLGSLGYGVASAFIPILNAEAVVLAAAAGGRTFAVLGVTGVTLGQAIGKVTIFLLVRKGVHHRFMRERPPRPDRTTSGWRLRLRTWSERMLVHLDQPVVGGLVVLASAAGGIPPLAVVAVMAGLRRTPLPAFVVAVLVGRLARFAVLAWPVAVIAS
jgi:membrane protein YqaA with SNARE-associated domain